jgi:hypothetical protein
VTFEPALMLAGAVYRPVESIVPTCGLMLHVTAVDEAFVTVAVNCWAPPAVRVALVGLIVMPTVGEGEIVIFAVPKMLESASLVAVTVKF